MMRKTGKRKGERARRGEGDGWVGLKVRSTRPVSFKSEVPESNAAGQAWSNPSFKRLFLSSTMNRVDDQRCGGKRMKIHA